MKRSAALLALAFWIVACGGDSDGGTQAAGSVTTTTTEAPSTTMMSAEVTTTIAPATTAAPTTILSAVADSSAAASVCGDAVEPGATTVRLTSGGIDRTYRRFVPSGYDGSTDVPVVMNFHGLTGSATGQALASGLDEVAERETFVALHPQGTKNSTGSTFFEFGIGGSGVDDVGFTADIIDQVSSELCVDETRLYAMGHSNGGYMSSRLACELSDQLAAIVTVSATIHPDDCNPTQPVPLLSFHATGDDVVPFDGGPSVFLGGRSASDIEDPPASIAGLVELFALEMPDEVGEWAETNGCDGQTASEGADGETLIVYVGCEAPVEFRVIDGGGHGWPGAPGSGPGPNATELAWEFLSRHTR